MCGIFLIINDLKRGICARYACNTFSFFNEMKIFDLQLMKYEINDHQDSRFYREVKHRKIVFYVYRESHNAINNAIKTAKSGLPLVS